MALDAMKKYLENMKIDKKLIKELVDNLKEFNLRIRISRWTN